MRVVFVILSCLLAAGNAGAQGVALVSTLDGPLGAAPWTPARIRSAVHSVAATPLDLTFTRPVTTTFIPVPAEEDERTSGLLVETLARPESDPLLAYLAATASTPGQKDVREALVAWRRARVMKLELALGHALDALTDADAERLRADPRLRAILEDVFEPVTVVRPATRLGSGPACGHIPNLRALPGPARDGETLSTDGFRVGADGRYLAVRTDAVIVLEDAELGDRALSLAELITSDLLGDVLAHEICHGIMGDLMGKDSPVGGSQSFQGHDTHIVTDRRMALSEGFAEAFEAWTGRDNPATARDTDPESFGNILWARQEAVRRNRYIAAGYQRFRRTRATGELKSGAQIAASEGAVAGLLHTLASHRLNPEGWGLVYRCLYLDRPKDVVALAAAMARRAADDRSRRALLRTFLWTTRFATVSGEALELYQEPGDAFPTFVRPLETAVLQGRLALDAALGPELWLDGTVKAEGKLAQVWRYDLNAATPEQLIRMGLSASGQERLVAYRAQNGAVRNLDELARVLDAADRKLLSDAAGLYKLGLIPLIRGTAPAAP